MYCPHCGGEMTETDAYCRHCGRPPIPPVVPPPLRVQQLPLAPYGARLGAFLLDGIFAGLLSVPGILIVLIGFLAFAGDRPSGAGIGLIVLGYLVAAIPGVYYSFAKDGFKGGASWGKRICDLRVVHLRTGMPCTKGQSALRQILYLMNAWGMITLVEIIMVFANSQRRRLGDLIAGTMVIPAEASVAPQVSPMLTQRVMPPQHVHPLSRHAAPPPSGPYDRQPPPQR